MQWLPSQIDYVKTFFTTKLAKISENNVSMFHITVSRRNLEKMSTQKKFKNKGENAKEKNPAKPYILPSLS